MEVADRPHHMIHERHDHIDPEPRLGQTSLYRPDLDLAVYDDEGNGAGCGLFWYNATTDNPAAGHPYLSVGFEPHRKNDLFAGPTSA